MPSLPLLAAFAVQSLLAVPLCWLESTEGEVLETLNKPLGRQD